MTAASLALGVRFQASSSGTVDFVDAGAVTGYRAGSVGLVNGKIYRYRAENNTLSEWEYGYGTWNSGTSTLARTTVSFSSSGAKVAFAAAPQVAIIPFVEDILSFTDAMALTSGEKDIAATNLGLVRAVRTQTFAVGGTYTPSTGMLYAVIECRGGGGGGGGVNGSTGQAFSGSGGGQGAFSRRVVSAATVGAAQTVTIGSGGAGGNGLSNGGVGNTTSVGALCVAAGGGGGLYGAAGQIAQSGAGGLASSGTGDFKESGAPGGNGAYFATAGSGLPLSGPGGGSGGGTSTGANNNSSAGSAGTSPGGGGSGAAIHNITGTNIAGAGANGVVFITEYCSQ